MSQSQRSSSPAIFSLLLFALSFALLIVGCARHEQPSVGVESLNGIIGATKVNPAKEQVAPAVLYLMIFADASGKYEGCTGSLIGPRTVLTAGHCVQAVMGQKLNPLEIDPQTKKVKNARFPMILVLSPSGAVGALTDVAAPSNMIIMRGHVRHDIALGRLQAPLFADHKKLSPLALLKYDRSGIAKPGTRVLAMGYGLVEKQSSNDNNEDQGAKGKQDGLQKKTFIVADPLSIPQANTRGPGDLFLVTPQGATPGMTCQGDSGGPILMKEKKRLVVVGVTSRGDRECMDVSIVTPTHTHAGWIASQMKKWQSKAF